jgi:DNA-binding transcriptional LysR family regulator
MLPKGLTLRGLEIFEALAATGSVAQTAEVTGLSQPAVSQQLRNLESALQIELVDHGKRPMRLTPAGRSFLGRAQSALSELRNAQSELTVMDLSYLSSLSMGIIDDFENDLIPRLASILADSLKNCKFKLVTAPSHEILTDIQENRLHMAIAASIGSVVEGVVEHQLARDPFILVAPKGMAHTPEALKVRPFLRYDSEQLIGRQIETHIARLKLSLDARFELGSHQALMAMVAQDVGWSITTPLGYMRAVRFHDKVDAMPLPYEPFARTISLYASADWADEVPLSIAQTMRTLLQTHMIEPAIATLPWLSGELRLL